MQKEQFEVQNVKCGGCVNAIQQGLKTVSGVVEVLVEIAGGKVTVNGGRLDRAALSAKLAGLGYPVK